jgi:hypothetical protein
MRDKHVVAIVGLAVLGFCPISGTVKYETKAKFAVSARNRSPGPY